MTWDVAGNIRGPAGAAGAQGPKGADSTVPGPTGPTGATGPPGSTTIAGITGLQAALDAKEATANKGQANGYCPLDSSLLIPSIFLPSYVDDVLEYSSTSTFPNPGEKGKIYVDLSTNKIYRWSGSAYVEISSSPGSTDQVVEGATNLYYTDARADARVQAGITTERSATRTLTNARVAPRTAVVTNQATWTINTDTTDYAENTGIATAPTITTTGTPGAGQRLFLAATATKTLTPSFGIMFEASSVALPTSFTTTRRDMTFIWNTATSKWRLVMSV